MSEGDSIHTSYANYNLESRGEKTADVLESNLDSLEKKIDDLLASFEESEHLKVEEANSKRSPPMRGSSKSGDDAGKNSKS